MVYMPHIKQTHIHILLPHRMTHNHTQIAFVFLFFIRFCLRIDSHSIQIQLQKANDSVVFHAFGI